MWLLIGFALGMGTAFAIHMDQHRDTIANVSHRNRAPATTNMARTDGKPLRHFDFYTLLPELNTHNTPRESDPAAQQRLAKRPAIKTAGAPHPATPAPARNGKYLLQAGSFKQYQQADSMKANLALLGVEANIKTVSVDQNTWHRVQIGPYRNTAHLDAVRKRLRKNHIDTLVLKQTQ